MEQINFGTIVGIIGNSLYFVDENLKDMYALYLDEDIHANQYIGVPIQFNTDENGEVVFFCGL